jgi:hypothetical protein
MSSQIQTLSSADWMHKPEAAAAASEAHVPPTAEFARNPDFFAAKSISELARSQRVVPVRDIKIFAGGISDEENLDEMLEEIYRLREP